MTPFLDENVKAYFDAIQEQRLLQALLEVRMLIFEIAPDAKESISYGIPTYKMGKRAFHIAAFAKHCSVFPGSYVAEFLPELEGYKTSKGTVQFTPDKPIPDDVLRRMIIGRLLEQ